MSRLAVFAYGSLVSPASFAETFGRQPDSLVPARLHGWRRRWSIARDNLAAEKSFAGPDGELPAWIVGLNIEPGPEDAWAPSDAHAPSKAPAPNGALIELDEAELERLDLREMRYDRVDVGGAVSADAELDRVVAYTAKPQHLSPEPPTGAVAMAPYLRTVEAAFRALGDGEWERFLASTGLPPVELIEPRLVRDEIPPGNPRRW